MALKMNKEGKLGCQKIEALFNIHVSSSLTSFFPNYTHPDRKENTFGNHFVFLEV